MTDTKTYPYVTHLDIKFPSLDLIDVEALAPAEAAERIRGRAIGDYLTAALERWARLSAASENGSHRRQQHECRTLHGLSPVLVRRSLPSGRTWTQGAASGKEARYCGGGTGWSRVRVLTDSHHWPRGQIEVSWTAHGADFC